MRHQLVEEKDQVGHLRLRFLTSLTHRGSEVRGFSVEEPQQQVLEDRGARVIDLFLLLVLGSVTRHQVRLPLLKQLGGHEGSVLTRPLVDDRPLAENHHNGLVLRTDAPALRQLSPHLLVEDVHTVVFGAAVETEPVHLLEDGEDLTHSRVLGVWVVVSSNVAPVLVNSAAPVIRVTHHRLHLLPELRRVVPGGGAQPVRPDVRQAVHGRAEQTGWSLVV